jgi:hypothetical protein
MRPLLLPSLTLSLFVLPLGVAAYTDGPFRLPEAAGITFLTERGVVQGNPDGTFRPGRTLNRAELLTIIHRLLARDTEPLIAPPTPCFSDVASSAWYAPVVCWAQAQGIVSGYPDGTFRADQAVLEVEALKMLVEAFEYDLGPRTGVWYLPYVAAAQARGTSIVDGTAPDAPLTRGRMARLAAAFQAEAEGELGTYRLAEEGRQPMSSMSSSTSSEASSSSSVSSTQSSEAASSSSQVSSAISPARNRFLVLGQRTPLVADGSFGSTDEVAVQGAEIRFSRELLSAEGVWLVDDQGTPLLALVRQEAESGKRWIWRAAAEGTLLTIPSNERRRLGIVIDLKAVDAGGSTEELVHVESFAVTLTPASGQAALVQSDRAVQPTHQTTRARIVHVEGRSEAEGSLVAGTKRELLRFWVAGDGQAASTLGLTSVQAHIERSGVEVTNWRLVRPDGTSSGCSIDSSLPTVLSCVLPYPSLALGEGMELAIVADLSIPAGVTSPSLRLSMLEAGSPSAAGDLGWTDGYAQFRWLDLEGELPKGPWLH